MEEPGNHSDDDWGAGGTVRHLRWIDKALDIDRGQRSYELGRLGPSDLIPPYDATLYVVVFGDVSFPQRVSVTGSSAVAEELATRSLWNRRRR